MVFRFSQVKSIRSSPSKPSNQHPNLVQNQKYEYINKFVDFFFETTILNWLIFLNFKIKWFFDFNDFLVFSPLFLWYYWNYYAENDFTYSIPILHYFWNSKFMEQFLFLIFAAYFSNDFKITDFDFWCRYYTFPVILKWTILIYFVLHFVHVCQQP